MRCMVIGKATAKTEAGVMPSEKELAAMGAFNARLAEAGVLVEGAGLKASSEGARITFTDRDPLVTDGPFAETKELIAGYGIWEVHSIEEAIEWARQAPFSDGEEVEIRPLLTAEDFGEAATDELKEKRADLERKVAEEHGS